MKRRKHFNRVLSFLLSFLLVVVCLPVAGPGAGADSTKWNISMEAYLDNNKVASPSDLGNIASVKLRVEGGEEVAVESFNALNNIQSAEQNFRVYVSATPKEGYSSDFDTKFFHGDEDVTFPDNTDGLSLIGEPGQEFFVMPGYDVTIKLYFTTGEGGGTGGGGSEGGGGEETPTEFEIKKTADASKGTITVTPSKAKAGETVEVKVTPKVTSNEGFGLTSLTRQIIGESNGSPVSFTLSGPRAYEYTSTFTMPDNLSAGDYIFIDASFQQAYSVSSWAEQTSPYYGIKVKVGSQENYNYKVWAIPGETVSFSLDSSVFTNQETPYRINPKWVPYVKTVDTANSLSGDSMSKLDEYTYSFTMPDWGKNLKVDCPTVSPYQKVFQITGKAVDIAGQEISDTIGALSFSEEKVGSSISRSGEGAEVIVTVQQKNANYVCTGVKADNVNAAEVEVGKKYAFTMPGNDVTVQATFKHVYSVAVASLSNITVTPNKQTAAAGETVTLTATPAANYKMDTISVTPAAGEVIVPTPSGSNTFTFTMPSSNVTIRATAVAQSADKQTLTATTLEGSKIAFKVNNNTVTAAYPGTAVTIEVTPPEGYGMQSLSFSPALENDNEYKFISLRHGVYAYSFTMPAAATTVTPHYKQITVDVGSQITVTNGTKDPATGSVNAGTPVTITADAATANQVFTNWSFQYNNGPTPENITEDIAFVQDSSAASNPATFKVPAIPSGTITITANYGAGYTVSFDANGGTGTVNPIGVAQSVGKIYLPSNGFTSPVGKVFGGWGTTTGDSNPKPAGTEVSVSSDVTYYAIWQDCTAHQWSEWTTVTAATCTEEGTKKHTCSLCRQEEPGDINALGHDLTEHPAQAATAEHTTGNLQYYSCSRCSKTFQDHEGKTERTSQQYTTYYIAGTVSHGTITVTDSATQALEGNTVSFTVTPAEDYSLTPDSVSVMAGSTSVNTTLVGSTYSFTMPNAPVTISADFATIQPAFSTTTLSGGAVGDSYSQQITATGGTAITYSVKSGTLPRGLTLGSDGSLSGIPGESGSFSFTVTATNRATSTDQALTLTVEKIPAPTELAAVNPTTAGGNGKITGTTDTMEYNTDANASEGWAPCTATETSLVPGTYYVRIKATDTTEAGAASEALTIQPAYSVTVTGGSVTSPTEITGYTQGTKITLQANEAPTGSTFSGWTIKDSNNSDISVSENKFTMPASDVTVTANYTGVNYTVTIANGVQHGTVTADPTTATYNSTITLTATPEAGYQLSSLTYTTGDSQAINIDGTSFTMPAGDVTVNAAFTPIDYTVTVNASTGGTARADKTTPVHVGDEITLTVTPDAGYQLSSLTYTTGDSQAIGIDGTSFTMPAGDVTVNATFTPINYTVTVNASTGGTVAANKTAQVHVGDEITLTATPSEGYEFASWTVKRGSADVTVTDNKFTMPAGNVTVSASFTQLTLHSINVTQPEGGGTLAVDPATAYKGSTVRITVTPANNYQLNALTVSTGSGPLTVAPEGAGAYTFTMPDTDVSVSASFSPRPVAPPSVPSATPITPVEDTPDGVVRETETTDAQGNVIATTVWADGKTSVVTTTPEGDRTIQVTNGEGETLVSAEIPDVPTGATIAFTDVAETKWYKKPIDDLVSRGVLMGSTRTTFLPKKGMARGALIECLYNLSGRPVYGTGTNPFRDSGGFYFEDSAAWGRALGIVYGTAPTRFNGRDAITREQMIVMLYRYANVIGLTDGSTDLNGFKDSARVSPYAREAMSWAVANHLIYGRTDGRLDPLTLANRYEAAGLLDRFIHEMM